MGEKYSREEARSIRIGLVVAVVIIALLALFAHFKKNLEAADKSTYDIKATYGRTDGLVVGDKVRLAGMDIGRITDAELDDNFHAVLTLSIKSSIKIPDDSSASIVSSAIMGSKYIEVEPGGSEDFLETGQEFSYTQDAIVLEELVERLIGIGKAKREPKEQAEMENLEKEFN